MIEGWCRLVVVVAAVAHVACSDGGGGGGGGGAASGGSTAVQIDASKIFRGSVSLAGTITLPPGSGGGKTIQLTVSGGGADITQTGSYVAVAGKTPGESVPYTIAGLVAGEYTVRARVDQNGDDRFDSPGDLDGHSGGTLAAPVLDFGGAKKVSVGASGTAGVDFALGVVK